MNCVCAVSRAYSIHRANRVGEKGHRRTLLPLWGNSPVVLEPLQGDTHPLSGGTRDFDGVRRMRSCQVPSVEGTGETEATLADFGRFRKQPTCHPGWYPKLHELPGMSRDSTLASCPEWAMSANEVTPRVSSFSWWPWWGAVTADCTHGNEEAAAACGFERMLSGFRMTA